MSSPGEIRAALAALRSGARAITAEQCQELLDAVEQMFDALSAAPRGGDPIASGVWYNHDRGPALARLADALTAPAPSNTPAAPGTNAVQTLAQQRAHDASIARALHQSLLAGRED